MARYQRIPEEVEAVPVTAVMTKGGVVPDWLEPHIRILSDHVSLQTNRGRDAAFQGDWFVLDYDGTIRLIRSEVFLKTYRQVPETM